MGYEDRLLFNIDRQRAPDAHPSIKRAHEKAKSILRQNAIDPENFIDLYGENNVNNDWNTVQRLKGRFEMNETQMTAEVLEAIFFEQSELSEWLGPNAETIRTSEYDDYINGVDLVAKFTDGDTQPNHLALGVDVTFGSQALEKKFDRTLVDIEKDTLSSIKYFESDNFKGSLKNIPRVVIGVENARVRELAHLWSEGEKRTLGEHPVRDVILMEISSQLQTFLAVAKKMQSERSIGAYSRSLRLIEGIRQSMQPRQLGDMKDDQVFKGIANELDYIRRSIIK